jgi:hypothetical protein
VASAGHLKHAQSAKCSIDYELNVFVAPGPLSVHARPGHHNYIIPCPGLPTLDLVITETDILHTVNWFEILAKVEFVDGTFTDCCSPDFAPVYREHLNSTFIRIDDDIYNADLYEKTKQDLESAPRRTNQRASPHTRLARLSKTPIFRPG